MKVQKISQKFVGMVGFPAISPNGLRLGEGGDFTTELHTKHTLQIYEKLSYEALNRHFCQTAVCALNGKYSSFRYKVKKKAAGECKSLKRPAGAGKF